MSVLQTPMAINSHSGTFKLSPVHNRILSPNRWHAGPAAVSTYKQTRHQLISRPRLSRVPGPRTCTSVSASAVAVAQASAPAMGVAAVVVGWLVIGGSVFRSIPQITRIIKRKSVVGLSFTSIVSELAVYIITVAYNIRFEYPFSTWGDTLMVAAQQAAIVGLVFHYNGSTTKRTKVATTVGVLAACAFLFSGICSDSVLRWLQGFSALLLSFGGRLPQIVLNWRRGNSGELSAASTGLSVLGNMARVFTTIVLVKDPIILATAATQLVLNSFLLVQIFDTARQERAAVVAAAI